jgi:hypothetical protein
VTGLQYITNLVYLDNGIGLELSMLAGLPVASCRIRSFPLKTNETRVS